MYQSSPSTAQSQDVIYQLEALLSDDGSSHLARAQLQQHISNSSSVQSRRASRVSKPSSASNSPQHFQRKRAITSQSIPRRRPGLYQQCLQIPQQSVGEESTEHQASARPFSWHPSSAAAQQCRPQSHFVASTRNSFNNYPSAATSGIPTPVTHPDLGLHLISRPWYDTDDASSLYRQSSDYDVCASTDLVIDTSVQDSYFTQPYPQYSSLTQPSSEGYAVFSPIQYPASAWTSTLSTFSTNTAPATPDFVPLQALSREDRPSPLPRKDSNELIGMGLYDGPDRHSWSLDSIMDGTTSLLTERPLSMGKGLKLEETWEPPEEDDSDSEEQDEEDDEQTQVAGSTEADNSKPQPAQQSAAANEQLPIQMPTINMMNHSFFFDRDPMPSQG